MTKIPPKVVQSKTLCESRKFRVIEEEIEFSDGSREFWEYAEQKGRGGVRILAVTSKNDLLFVREYRAAARKYVVRVPTGAIADEESPKKAALRELEEETGFRAENIVQIGKTSTTSSYYKTPPMWLFFAKNLTKTREKRDKGEQDMEILTIPLTRVYEMVENLEIEDPSTIYAILALKKWKVLLSGNHKNIAAWREARRNKTVKPK